MNVLVIILAAIGLVLLVLLAAGALSDRAPQPPPPDDPAMPYREGLRAAIRIQRVAHDLEQQIYAEAAQAMRTEAERE